MFSNGKSYTDIAENSRYQNPDGRANTNNRTLNTFTTVQDDCWQPKRNTKITQGVVAAAQTSLSSAWAHYQKTSLPYTLQYPALLADYHFRWDRFSRHKPVLPAHQHPNALQILKQQQHPLQSSI